MRALCGAIITAGALIGLGLAALGYGTRYHGVPYQDMETGAVKLMKWSETDRALIFAVVFLTSAAIVGLGIAFLGLAYHHERRCKEMSRELGRESGSRVPV